ncbi:polysaccharide pyruvyl transferase CsaB [Paenibacillus koleovorans]|uniref:polysaccharide pyruvyl transferase CsaB n=1 Tax=Paenibacillus koleovorans TaxID=121608 RepID=UPI000FD6DBE7|nr:polysaccharide pyruvyl transferase CsaB [Paenibacillus koleovorans]
MVPKSVKRIAISGYYGFNNSGDEAVLQSILLALQAEGAAQGVQVEPVVLSADPNGTAKMYGVEAVPRMKLGEMAAALRRCDGLISGGGSLLQDATGALTIPYYLGILRIAQWLGKPTFIYSQGIGPVYRRIYDPFIRMVFKKCRYISVRDQESADLLVRMGVPSGRIDVVPDPVMGLPRKLDAGAAAAGSRDLPVVGVSVRFWNKERAELDALAAAIVEAARDRDAVYRFLPFHLPSDEEASRHVIHRIGQAARTELASGITHPQDMLAEVGACDALIGMRLHSLIYAASQSVPLMGISYDPKINQFLQRLDMQASASTAPDKIDFSAEQVKVDLLGLLEGASAWRSAKQDRIQRLKQEANRPAQQILAALR